MGLPITPIIDFLNSVICGICSFLLFRSFQREPGRPVLRFFAQGYLSLVVSYLFFSVPRIAVPEDSLTVGIGFVIAQAFLFLAVAFFAKVTMFFVKVQWAQRIFWLVVFISAIGVLLSIMYFGYPEYDPVTSITNWNIHISVSIVSVLVFAGVLLPSAVYFFFQGFRSQDQIVRKRSTIIAIGLVFLTVTAFTYYSATTRIVALVSDILSLLSFLIIFFGVIYKRGARYEESKTE
ncbi:MAG: hypothetical protein PHY34_04065 [Patescibacteria group bacterium]|nr:hypothetical protein [Patescibacteria group bacterium]MDD5715498.1 hypothetical protein [Patescibacteria group bacterium]